MCTELLQRLVEFQPRLAGAVALAAEVDCLISLAQCARDYGYCRPRLTQDDVLHIKQGKHCIPLVADADAVALLCSACRWSKLLRQWALSKAEGISESMYQIVQTCGCLCSALRRSCILLCGTCMR